MTSQLNTIEYYLPENILSNQQLSEEFPEWTVEKIQEKTGIKERRIAAKDEFVSDLAFNAASKLFAQGVCQPSDIDFILFCTQCPDYLLPTTACLLQQLLDIPKSAGALDFNLGCSGYIYGLSLATGLIGTDQASSILLITADTYSKFIDPTDKSVRTIFGDAASASLITKSDAQNGIGPFVFGTDGSGKNNLIIENSGCKALCVDSDVSPSLYMNGGEIFTFAVKIVPKLLNELLEKAQLTDDDIDFYVFHQANQYMLEHLRKKIGIQQEKMIISMEFTGNTVSSTIPIALYEARAKGIIKKGMRIALVGFGVGYSWGATLITIV